MSKPKKHILVRVYDGAHIYYTGASWSDLKRAAKRYSNHAQAIALAEEMSENRESAVYVVEA